MEVALPQELYHFVRLSRDRGDLSVVLTGQGLRNMQFTKLDPERVNQSRMLDVEMWNKVNALVVDWVRKPLSAAIKTALLSNVISYVAHYARRNFQWLASFNRAVLSSEVGLVKPYAAIFERCLQFLALSPSEALLVDDSEPTVRTAQALGMVAIQFDSAEQLKNQLVALDFKIPNEPLAPR